MKFVDILFDSIAFFRFDFDPPISTQASFALIAQGSPDLPAICFTCKTNSGKSVPMTKVTLFQFGC